MYRSLFAVLALAGTLSAGEITAEKWPQFRGPAGSAVGAEDASFPTEFGASSNLLWRTELPTGHGSPCIWGERIFVTAFDPAAKTLEVIAVDRQNGKIAWRKAAPPAEIEKVHEISSPATSTPATDGERIYVYFGSYGLLAYDWDGNLVWKHPMGVSKSPFGSGSSPIVAGDLILINRDYPPEPYLLAVNRADGRLAWKTGLEPGTGAGPKTSHATPVLWKEQVVLNRPGSVSAYRLNDGSQVWRVLVDGTATSTLTASGDEIYAAAYTIGSDPEGAVELESFDSALVKYDTDGDGALSNGECPDNGLYFRKRVGVPDGVPGAHFNIKLFFRGIDRDKDGKVNRQEYERVQERSKTARVQNSGLFAIRPDGEGDLTLSAVRWTEPKGTPEVPAPLAYRGRVYAIANGGVLTCLDAQSGKVLYRGRVRAPGAYYASPVAAGSRIIVASEEGVVTILGGEESLEIEANNDLGEQIFGTPAPVGSALYVRSLHHLWAFGTGNQRAEARPPR